MILKAFKYRLYPTEEQAAIIHKSFAATRFVTNYTHENVRTVAEADLIEWRAWKAAGSIGDAPKSHIFEKISEMEKEIKNIRAGITVNGKDTSWTGEVQSIALGSAMRNYAKAWVTYFKNMKDGTIEKMKKDALASLAEKKSKMRPEDYDRKRSRIYEDTGKPKFKHGSGRQSYQFHQGYIPNFEDSALVISKVGAVEAVFHRLFDRYYEGNDLARIRENKIRELTEERNKFSDENYEKTVKEIKEDVKLKPHTIEKKLAGLAKKKSKQISTEDYEEKLKEITEDTAPKPRFKTCTISRIPSYPKDKFFASILVECDGELPEKQSITPETTMGVHLGITDMATTKDAFVSGKNGKSKESVINNDPQFYEAVNKKIKNNEWKDLYERAGLPNYQKLEKNLKKLQILHRAASRKDHHDEAGILLNYYLITYDPTTNIEPVRVLAQDESSARKLAIPDIKILSCRRCGMSQNQKDVYAKIARLNHDIENQRNYLLHALSNKILGVPGVNTIAFEDFDIKSMMQNRHLARKIADVSWSKLKGFVGYKAELRGKNVIKTDEKAATSKTCSACGTVNDNLEMKHREWDCSNCGTHHHRSKNAAKNVEQMALSKFYAEEKVA